MTTHRDNKRLVSSVSLALMRTLAWCALVVSVLTAAAIWTEYGTKAVEVEVALKAKTQDLLRQDKSDGTVREVRIIAARDAAARYLETHKELLREPNIVGIMLGVGTITIGVVCWVLLLVAVSLLTPRSEVSLCAPD
jgi:hypothetical protein